MRKFFQRAMLHKSESTEPGNGLAVGLSALLRDEHGAIMIETAISYMILITMLLGIFECCMMGYTYSVAAESAREGVRYASVHGTDSPSCSGPSSGCADATATNVVNDVKAYAATFTGNLSGIHVVVTYPDGVSTGTSRVQVNITYTYYPMFHLPMTTHTFTASSTGRILY